MSAEGGGLGWFPLKGSRRDCGCKSMGTMHSIHRSRATTQSSSADVFAVRRVDSIVGKGNHSPNHIQKIKPKVEEICRELGLQYATEANAGRMYINLQGGEAVMPEHLKAHHGGGYHQGYGGPGYGQQQQQQQQQPQGYQGGNTYPQMNYQQGGGGQQQQYHGGGGGGQQQQYHGGGGGGQQQQDPNAEIEAQVKKYLPTVLRMCQKQCCTVM